MVNIGATSTLLRYGQHWRYFHAAQMCSTLALLPLLICAQHWRYFHCSDVLNWHYFLCSDVLNIGATSTLLRHGQHWRYFHCSDKVNIGATSTAQIRSTLALLPLLR
ncbi:hypothetical protein RRG08_024422 [Elysia crispata]|uniref:Uncharacterized protein n=1 Tax=Elysia crispata TaxID=231223 RepID=A0AAE0YP44_9GAST|nr:hypothetical protein RRG08_024422 [Elysia crispata]